MSVRSYITEKYHTVAAGGSVLVGGAALAVCGASGLGPVAFLVAGAAGTASMIVATLLRPAEEIDSFEQTIDKILAVADNVPEIEMGGARTANRKNRDLKKIQEFLNLGTRRRGTLGEEFLLQIATMGNELTQIVNNPKGLDGNPTLAFNFDILLHKNIIQTVEIFCETPGAATNVELREEFADQLKDLQFAISDIQKSIDGSAIRQFQSQGYYLESVYNPEQKALESE